MDTVAAGGHFPKMSESLATIADVVLALLCEKQSDDDADFSEPFFFKVDRRLRGRRSLNDMRDLLFSCAEFLLAFEDGNDFLANAEFQDWCRNPQRDLTPSSIAAAENAYVEFLAGTALGLYFLGEPFSHPWERVRRWVEQEGGGLPNGACVAKAIGDLVRATRNSIKRRSGGIHPGQAGEAPANDHSQLIILSYLPLALFKSLVRGKERKGCAPDACHVLGRCYELLQIRLYANEGLPLKYFVPRDLVRSQLLAGGDEKTAAKELLEWLGTMFGTQDVEGQYVGLVDLPMLPAVFLNRRSGLYTFETVPDAARFDIEIPLPASYMREARRNLYWDTLDAIQIHERNNLLRAGKAPEYRSIHELVFDA